MEFELTTIHLVILAVTAIVIVYADHEAFAYFRGKKQLLSAKRIHRLHILVWCGLIGMILTGILLTIPTWEYRLTQPEFYIKMGLVLTLVVNAGFISKVSGIATKTPFLQLTPHEKVVLLVSGAVSAGCWIGAGVIGYFFL